MPEFARNEPFDRFAAWLKEAEEKEINDPNAMAIATVDAAGRPSLRMVLLKGQDELGFVF
jgi:pyridoxamine 5'-phosphate oxidase